VFEETGFDVSIYVRENEYIERVINDQRMRLYIIAGINEDIKFTTQTRKEIGDIKWHDVSSLPGYNGNLDKSARYAVHTNNKKYKFYLVTPFVAPLRKWIKNFKKAKQQGKARKNAALKVVMDQVTGDSEGEEEDNEYESSGDHTHDYTGVVPTNQQVHLEDSLKKLLGLGQQHKHDDWEVADRLSQSLPDPNRVQPIPFGAMPGMEMPSIYSQEQYNVVQAHLVQPSEVAGFAPHQGTSEQSDSEADAIEENSHKNDLISILVGKQSATKKKGKKKLGYGEVKLLRHTDNFTDDSTARPISPPPKKELVDLLLNPPKGNSPKLSSPAINTEGLLKLLIQSPSPRASDPGLEQVLSGKKPEKVVSPLNPDKQSLEDILRGAPPLPMQPQSQMLQSPHGNPNILENVLVGPPTRPPFSHTMSEHTFASRPAELQRTISAAPNPYAGSLLDILTQKPATSPNVTVPKSTPKSDASDKKSDLLNILLNNK
jgi:hypothetical protein